MDDLIKVPNFTFNQGDIWGGTENAERPIQVNYYHGIIELRQQGEYKEPETIQLTFEHYEALFKLIKKHFPEAKKELERSKNGG